MTMPLIRQGEGILAAIARIERERTEREQKLAAICLETDTPIAPINGNRLPGDPRQLRGIPVVGVHGGIGGHIPGSNPSSIRA